MSLFPATYHRPPRDLPAVIVEFEETRREIISTLLRLNRDAWRIKPHHGKWCVAQIVEHLNDVDRNWWRVLIVANRLQVLFPAKPQNLRATVDQPFGKTAMRALKIFSNPRGRKRRKHMIGGYEQTARKIVHLLEQLSERKLGQLRMFSPIAGIIGVADALAILTYHDQHHYKQILACIDTLRQKNIPTEYTPDES
ncbi:MAG: DinB family protein [bacterium]|nr:DinB family protein [bacterium]